MQCACGQIACVCTCFHIAPATQAALLNLLASLDIYLEAHINTGLQTSVQITSGAIQLRPSFQLCDVSVANVQARVLAPQSGGARPGGATDAL